MPGLFELGDEVMSSVRQNGRAAASIVSGIVSGNFDTLNQGRVLVRVPVLEQEVWARLVAIGAGNNRGFLFVPQPQDEVLLALNMDEPQDAFVLGGLWNITQNRMPQTSPPEAIVKRTLRTGLVGGRGHTIEFDDLLQSITITSMTDQKISINPDKIEIEGTGGTLSITMDLKQQKIKISAPQIEIGGSDTLNLSLNAKKISVGSGSTVDTVVKGALVRIN